MNYLTAHPFISLSAAFGVVAVLLAWLILSLYRRWNTIFGKGPRSSADALGDALERLARVEAGIGALETRVEALEDIGKVAIQKVGFLRFNPFEHTGGDQSFAVALLDKEGSGVIISSLYTRDGVRTYAKAVERGAAKHPLSTEEQHVLREALGK